MLVMTLKAIGTYVVVGDAAGGVEGLKICRATTPDLVILDLQLPELNGSHVIRLLLAESWPVRVVVFTGVTEDSLLREAMAEGPHGFVHKQDSLPSLYLTLRAVMSGSRHLSRCSEHLAPKRTGETGQALTPQERAVLQMIAEGRQNKEIATVLAVSEKTVEHHRQHVMQKLGLRDVASLTRYAIRHRMVAA
jgi:DNA-binding NarL/FixJ family response regulator